jgi:hypothetical protein
MSEHGPLAGREAAKVPKLHGLAGLRIKHGPVMGGPVQLAGPSR